jgi:signal transduction histidine kinase/CheY-like chemotaxis protein
VGLAEGDEIEDRLLLNTLQHNHADDIISDDFIMRPDVQEISERGEVKGYAVFLSDLTEERRQLEKSQQLKREAEIANRAKSDFLAQMSHEIRTPINAVLGMNEMILRESREPEVQKYALDIKNSAHALLSIINEILDLAKIESGKMELIRTDYEMYSLLNDLYSMMNIKAKEKGLSLIFDIQKDIPCGYYGDDIRLRQILMNLLSNALKYTNEGYVTFSIRGGAKGDTAYLRFAVTDTGIGIREEDMEHLFDKYERFDESEHRQTEGTGLGMNITLRLLHLMDSELKVDSTYGRGSCFYFDLHQPITNREPLGDFSSRVMQKSQEEQPGCSYEAEDAHVLVVDDNSVNRRVFKNLLKQTRMHIDEAGGGRQALEMIKENHYDLIFLDHMMPEMDGIETWHALEQMDVSASGNTDTPVIMLTANAVVGAEEAYRKEGFADFLTKPIIPEKLDAVILRHLPPELVQKKDLH